MVQYPNLKIFSTEVLSTPKLKYIYLAKEQMVPVDDEYDRLNYHEFTQEQQLWDGDLNASMKQFWEANFDTFEKVCCNAFIQWFLIIYQVIGFKRRHLFFFSNS